MKIVLIVCKSVVEQMSLQNVNINMRKSIKAKTVTDQLNVSTRAMKQANQVFTQNLTFGVIENKLVWLDYERKLVSHVNLDQDDVTD